MTFKKGKNEKLILNLQRKFICQLDIFVFTSLNLSMVFYKAQT